MIQNFYALDFKPSNYVDTCISYKCYQQNMMIQILKKKTTLNITSGNSSVWLYDANEQLAMI